ncbi:MAG: cytochrome C [Lunatimonas sp.]|uniref:c-type cytochrome n=1 Tax=Lunatimonas sp. TaxID=2060141 RepID=UPI00263B656A|nr:c-type cytochrome [Lunatimonas sp.]MCC5938092.1 cytochrome C [Lunatimonas sp.]
MKLNKTLSLAVVTAAILATSCGGSGSKTETTSSAPATSAPAPQEVSPEERHKDNPDFAAGLALVKQNDCPSCHMVDRKIVGPSYGDVSEKYELTDANVALLASHVINGNVGVWGEIPMPAHPALSREDAELMVKYVLLLKK